MALVLPRVLLQTHRHKKITMIFKDQMFDCLLLTLKVVSDYKTLSPDSGWASIAKRFQCAYVHALKPKEAMQMIQLHLLYLLFIVDSEGDQRRYSQSGW